MHCITLRYTPRNCWIRDHTSRYRLKWLYQFPLSSAICKSFICSQPHLHLVIMSVFAFSHSGTCMVVSPCGLICTFQKTNEVEELLVTYWPFRHPLLWWAFSSHFSIGSSVLFLLICGGFYIFLIQVFLRCIQCNYLLLYGMPNRSLKRSSVFLM